MSYYQNKIEALEAENARLKADYEVIEKHLRIRIERDALREAGEILNEQRLMSGDINREKNETIARLKAENERLRKAGDAMEDAIIDGGLNALNKARDEWNAVKEGKPSA